MNKKDNSGVWVKTLGDEYAPPKNINAKLGRLLGVKRGEKCPRFTTDPEFTLELLKKLDSDPVTLSTTGGEYICVFHANGVVTASLTSKTKGVTQAVALLYLLTAGENG